MEKTSSCDHTDKYHLQIILSLQSKSKKNLQSSTDAWDYFHKDSCNCLWVVYLDAQRKGAGGNLVGLKGVYLSLGRLVFNYSQSYNLFYLPSEVICFIFQYCPTTW